MSKAVGGKKGRGKLTAWIVAVVVIAAFALRFAAVRATKTVDSIESIQAREGKPVEVVDVTRGELNVWTPLAGTVEGISQYPLVSTNSIQVIDVVKREGDAVKKGDVVIRLGKDVVNPMLLSYKRSKALYDDALRDATRMRNLYEEGAVSKQALDKAEMALKIARSDLEGARESVDIRAAFPGIITSMLVEKGEMANNGKPLAWIARTDSVKIVFHAGSRQAMMMARGQKAVWKNSDSGDSGEGYISKIDLSADPATHLVSGEAVFANPDGRLIPGLLVSFDVLTFSHDDVLKIPVECIMDAPQGKAVYVVNGSGEDGKRAKLTMIKTGVVTSDCAEIKSGLEEGDRVVRFGQDKLTDGILVKVVTGKKEG
jgi:membrane fusion protein (multidrug efflux system)